MFSLMLKFSAGSKVPSFCSLRFVNRLGRDTLVAFGCWLDCWVCEVLVVWLVVIAVFGFRLGHGGG